MADPAETKPLKVDVLPVAGRTLLAPDGALTHETLGRLDAALQEAPAPGGRRQIILDGKAVPIMDSAALERLLTLHETLAQEGGSLTLIHLTPVCLDILMATRLRTVLHVLDDLNQAIRQGGTR